MPGTRYAHTHSGIAGRLAAGAVLGVSLFENIIPGIVIGILVDAGSGSGLPGAR